MPQEPGVPRRPPGPRLREGAHLPRLRLPAACPGSKVLTGYVRGPTGPLAGFHQECRFSTRIGDGNRLTDSIHSASDLGGGSFEDGGDGTDSPASTCRSAAPRHRRRARPVITNASGLQPSTLREHHPEAAPSPRPCRIVRNRSGELGGCPVELGGAGGGGSRAARADGAGFGRRYPV